MEDGIKLSDDNEQIKTESEENECFGGAMCVHLEYRREKVIIFNDRQIETKQYWCKYNDKSVGDKCPIGRWRKLAVPIGYQNIGFNASFTVKDTQNETQNKT